MSRLPRAARIAAAGAAALVAAAAIGFVGWALTPAGPEADAIAAIEEPYPLVTVARQSAGWTFAPVSGEPSVGLAFYPGGRVDARAYAPLARELAERGYLVVVQPMPLNLAVFGSGRAAEAIETHPEIAAWAVGGHSLGGVMAARYAAEDERVRGLVLLAAYPPPGTDLSAREIEVLSLRGTLDTVLDDEAYEAGRSRLPPDAVFAQMRGGNHAQFGSYGPQAGDTPAQMPAEGQRTAAADAIEATLVRVAATAAR